MRLVVKPDSPENPFGEAAIADESEPAGDEPTETAIRV